jgi:hypothetical protein
MTTENGQPPALDPRQEKLVLALLVHGELKRAARATAVPYTTAKRWASQDDFKAALRRHLDEATAAAFRVVASTALRASEVLRAALEDADARIKLKAADTVLRHLESVTLLQVQEKLEKLEAKAKGEPPLRPWAG